MLFSLIENLEKVDIILASASPRRFELLKTIGLQFDVVKSNVQEETNIDLDPIGGALHNARLKGKAVAEKHSGKLVISADTIVVLDNQAMGKPKDEEDAFRMLSQLSGKTHQVHTAFGLILYRYEKEVFDTVSTDVTFRDLSDDEIWSYVNTGEPFDKAGGYAVQGQGAVLIDRINGCFFNVVGFPLSRFFVRLDEFLSSIVL